MASTDNKAVTELGFAGLLSWVGNSESLIGRTESQHKDKISSKPVASKPPAFPDRQEREEVLSDSSIGTQPTKMPIENKVAIWTVVVLVGVGLIAWANSNDNSHSSGQNTSSSDASPAPTGPPLEVAPPIASDAVLDISELHYCLAQGIRIDAAHDVVNTNIQDQIDRFNAVVTDFNSRCGSFRYRQSDMNTAKSDVEQYRSVYQTQGRSQFQ